MCRVLYMYVQYIGFLSVSHENIKCYQNFIVIFTIKFGCIFNENNLKPKILPISK